MVLTIGFDELLLQEALVWISRFTHVYANELILLCLRPQSKLGWTVPSPKENKDYAEIH